MISIKIVATLLLITLNMQLAASTSTDNTQEPSSSNKPALRMRKQRRVPRTKENMLQDTDSTVNPVKVQGKNTEEMNTSKEQPVPQVKSQFEVLIEQRNFKEIFEVGSKMEPNEFMKQLCSVVKTFEQYNEIVGYLKDNKMVALFFVYGIMVVVREVIMKSGIYGGHTHYIKNGDLETALPLALKNDCHDRVISFLNVRQEVTAGEDKERKQGREQTNFEYFMFDFLHDPALWKDDMALRRFLALRGDELRTNHSDIFDTLCQMLVWNLTVRLDEPKATNLLVDLIGQPSLLTPVMFTKGFLRMAFYDKDRSIFLQCGWAEAIQEGLKVEYPCGGADLWQVMEKERSDQPPGEFPLTADERAIVCKRFPTKQQKENERIKYIVAIICSEVESPESNFIILPTVLWTIVAEYAVSLLITKISTAPPK